MYFTGLLDNIESTQQLHNLCWDASQITEARYACDTLSAMRLEGYLDLDLGSVNAAARRNREGVSLNIVTTRVRTRNFEEVCI